MNRTIGLITLIASLLSFIMVYSQEECGEADSNFEKAIKSMDSKQYVLAEELLHKAIALCPDNELKYSYELAWNYMLMEEYQAGIDLLEPLMDYDSITAEFYQLLGNIYDESGEEGMAIIIYDKGFEKFPNSGCLFLERGNVSFNNDNYTRAIFYYEEGIEHDPMFSSNYFRVADIYLGSSEEVWGLVYGELFMLLERHTQRTREMSKKLYDTYHSEMSFTNTGVIISLNDPTIIYSDSPQRPNLFPDNYHNALLKASKREKLINIETLVNIRTRFVGFFNSQSRQFRNVLFDYHKRLIDNGHFEAYNYWLFAYGNPTQASKWINENKTRYDSFLDWMEKNPIQINNENTFTRYRME